MYEWFNILASRYNTTIDNVLSIALNRYGIIMDNCSDNRIRFNLRFNDSERENYFAVCVNTYAESPFSIKENTLYLEDIAIGKVLNIEKDTCTATYFRNNKKAITLNSNSRSKCFGCKFCGTYCLTEDDNYDFSTVDNVKQYFNILLQENMVNDFISPNIENELRLQEDKFTTYNNLLVYVGNWNVAGKELKSWSNLFEWLLPSNVVKEGQRPDLYIIGFQEIVDLNATNVVFFSNNTQKNQWKTIISDALASLSNKSDPYVLIKELDLVGIYLITFIKKSCMPGITNLDFTYIKSGLMGNIGNKGSCLLRFNIHDNTFAIACNHLSAGKKYSETRRGEVIEILNKTFDKYPNLQFKDYDYYFFFGDVNSRINLEIPQCVDLIVQKNYKELLNYDQFKNYRKETSLINQMEEGEINFNPTYKYIIGSNEYDTTKRTPSWCDRIFFKKGSQIEVLAYNKCDFTLSDHKPIYGIYNMKTSTVNKEKKNKLLQQIMKENENSSSQNGFNKRGNINCKNIIF